MIKRASHLDGEQGYLLLPQSWGAEGFFHPLLLLQSPGTASICCTASSQVAALRAMVINYYLLSGVMAHQCLQLRVFQPDWREIIRSVNTATRVVSLPAVLLSFLPSTWIFQGERGVQKNSRGCLKRQPTTKPLTRDERDQRGLQLHVLSSSAQMKGDDACQSLRKTACPGSLCEQGHGELRQGTDLFPVSHHMLQMQSSHMAAANVLCRKELQDHEVTQLPFECGLCGIYGTLSGIDGCLTPGLKLLGLCREDQLGFWKRNPSGVCKCFVPVLVALTQD